MRTEEEVRSEQQKRRHEQLREATMLATFRENLVRAENDILDSDARRHIVGARTLRSVIGDLHTRIEYLLDAPVRELNDKGGERK